MSYYTEIRQMTGPLDVLIVDDTDGCRDLYSLWFEAEYSVETAPNGTVALDQISNETDIVLLDRNMPGPSGLDVASEIRSDGYDCQIVMVSSERREFDISASPVDDYVQKPADRETLVSAVEQIATQRLYQSALSEYFAVSATVGRAETRAPRDQLETVEEYLRLREQAEQKRADANSILDGRNLDWETAFQSLQGVAGGSNALAAPQLQ